MYPTLLLPLKSIDFGYVLQLVSQPRIEQNSMDMLFGLLNLSGQNLWPHGSDSNCSSLEILRVLTSNIPGGDEDQQFDETVIQMGMENNHGMAHSLQHKHIEHFLKKERLFLSQIILKLNQICPTMFAGPTNKFDFKSLLTRGMKIILTYVGIILDHIVVWWMDTPMSSYAIGHTEALQNWVFAQSPEDIPEPVHSILKGFAEILSNFISNNLWDQQFRLTLVSSADQTGLFEFNMSAEIRDWCTKNADGTPTGAVWVSVFTNLRMISNNICSENVDSQNLSLLPIAEQIPILHRIDHSVHCMRLWVKEQAKFLCAKWKMDTFFKTLECDIKTCLETLALIKLPKLNADSRDILTLVCVALRAKLICEIDVNIDKLKKTSSECIETMSSVCWNLSLAKFSLCFPAPEHWQQSSEVATHKNEYVHLVLNQLYLPIIKATQDIVILKLILKIICEAWLDHIYKRKIKFSVSGAIMLQNDFDKIREWIKNCSLLSDEYVEKLSKHEVLRMCKGVGKILLRKPEDVISIVQSPKHESIGTDETTDQGTQLPSEMFVSNQKNWLELRAASNNFPMPFCCD